MFLKVVQVNLTAVHVQYSAMEPGLPQSRERRRCRPPVLGNPPGTQGQRQRQRKKQHWRRGTQLRKAPAGAPTGTAIEKFSQTRLKRNPSVWRPHPARRWCAQLRKTGRRNQPPYTHPTQLPRMSRSSQLARVTPQSPSQTGHPSPKRESVGQKKHISCTRSVSFQAKPQFSDT